MSCRRGDFGEVTIVESVPLFSENGFWVVNEGMFGFGNGEISFIDPEKETISNGIFMAANGVQLGDIPFDLFVDEDVILITVNNSSKVWVLHKTDFTIQYHIIGVTSPRCIEKIANGMYAISSFANDSLYFVDLNDDQPIVSSMYTGKSTEGLLMHGNVLYAANWSAYGGNFDNSTIQMINPISHTLLGYIQVGKEPCSMQIDKNGDLWVLCSGGYMGEEKPRLFKINAMSNEVEKQFEFSDVMSSPISLSMNPEGDKLYYLNNDLYRMSIYDDSLPNVPIVDAGNMNFYAVDASHYNDTILVANARDFQTQGDVVLFNNSGQLQNSYTAGIIPSRMIMNK